MENHQSYSKSMKVAIIGAGITGLYLAWKLSENGHQVTVFEKKSKIGKEACSGLFSEKILQFIPESKSLIENKISSVLIHFPKKTIQVKFSKTFFVMEHAALDRYVAELAVKSGAEIILQKSIDSLPIEFDKIIGCDGAHSFVRKSLNLKEPYFRLGILGFVPQPNASDRVETWPVEKGFIWKIPRCSQTEYGIMAEPKKAREFFAKFLKKNNLRIERLQSAMIPQGLSISENAAVTLCGDAAGLTKPWSGGGVIWGLTGADILLKNFPDFIEYQKGLKKFFGKKIIFSRMSTNLVYFLGFNFPWILSKNIEIESDFLV